MSCSSPVLPNPTSYRRKQSSALERTNLYSSGTAGEVYVMGQVSRDAQLIPTLPPAPAVGCGTVELLSFHFAGWLALNTENHTGDFLTWSVDKG